MIYVSTRTNSSDYPNPWRANPIQFKRCLDLISNVHGFSTVTHNEEETRLLGDYFGENRRGSIFEFPFTIYLKNEFRFWRIIRGNSSQDLWSSQFYWLSDWLGYDSKPTSERVFPRMIRILPGKSLDMFQLQFKEYWDMSNLLIGEITTVKTVTLKGNCIVSRVLQPDSLSATDIHAFFCHRWGRYAERRMPQWGRKVSCISIILTEKSLEKYLCSGYHLLAFLLLFDFNLKCFPS